MVFQTGQNLKYCDDIQNQDYGSFDFFGTKIENRFKPIVHTDLNGSDLTDSSDSDFVSEPEYKIVVKYSQGFISRSDLFLMFERFGKFKIYIPKKYGNVAFVTFKKKEHFNRAFDIDGIVWEGRTIEIECAY
jgi:hypothetical protein